MQNTPSLSPFLNYRANDIFYIDYDIEYTEMTYRGINQRYLLLTGVAFAVSYSWNIKHSVLNKKKKRSVKNIL